MKFKIFSFLIVLLMSGLLTSNAYAQFGATTTDTTTTPTPPKSKKPDIYQLRIGVDLFRPILSAIEPNKYGFELQADYTIKSNTFLAGEIGYGGCKVDKEFLKYTGSNGYLKLGLDAPMLEPRYNKDFDIVYVGFRYGVGIGKMGDATFTVDNPFGPIVSDEVASRNYVAHWGEILAGLKMEVLPNWFLGWNVKAKFFINAGLFNEEVAPSYIAGFGPGDKSTSFDFNFYLSRSIRWKKK